MDEWMDRSLVDRKRKDNDSDEDNVLLDAW